MIILKPRRRAKLISSRTKLFFVFAVTIIGGLQISLTVNAAAVVDRLESSVTAYRQQSLAEILEKAQNPQHLSFMGQQLAGFWNDQSPALQGKIDRAFELIFSTETGKSWLASLLFNSSLIGKALATECRPDRVKIENTGTPAQLAASYIDNRANLAKQLNFFWGFSLPLAQKIVGAPLSADPNVGHHSVNLQFADGRTEALLPKFYFLSRGTNSTGFDSYTSVDNKTIIMIDDKQDPDSQLIGVLAHEAAVTGDAKANLFAWASRHSYRDLSLWQTRLADPAFNSIFATMRAFRTETMVFQDLAQLSKGFEKSSQPNPWAINDELRPYATLNPQTCLQEYQRLVKAKYLKVLGISDQDRDELLKYFDRATTITRCDGTRVNACMEFATIETGARVQNSSGPRPRIGSDW